MKKTITSKGRTWELLNSIWMLWTLTVGFFNYISFFYIAYRVKQKKWTVWGIIYSIPFIAFIISSEALSSDHWLYNFIMIIYFIMWIVSIFHAFKVRAEYLLRLEAYGSVADKEREHLRKEIAKEYANEKSQSEVKVEKQVSSQTVIEPVDINLATEQQLAEIPSLGLILAKKAMAKREEIGSFQSIEHFGDQIGLKPHVLERVKPYLKVSQTVRESSNAESQTGRIVDF